jgi:hypothetical protein
MPEDMPDRMPNRMSEDMSDRMPEDLPVRKCINVMVGITRSKVIEVFSPIRSPNTTFEKGWPVLNPLQKGCWEPQFPRDWTNPWEKGMVTGGLRKH